MNRTNPGLVVASLLQALNFDRAARRLPLLADDAALAAFIKTLPACQRVHVADRARQQDRERQAYRLRALARRVRPKTEADHDRLAAATAKRARKARARLAAAVAGGWADWSSRYGTAAA